MTITMILIMLAGALSGGVAFLVARTVSSKKGASEKTANLPYPLPPSEVSWNENLKRIAAGLDPENRTVLSHFEAKAEPAPTMKTRSEDSQEQPTCENLGNTCDDLSQRMIDGGLGKTTGGQNKQEYN